MSNTYNLAADGKTQFNLPDGYDWSDYRAYVGLPTEYDLFSAMVFNLLTTLGLRQHHRVLDVGCGSLRNGRLLIPYLNPDSYWGVDPNQWLVETGIEQEIGADMTRIKRPEFSFQSSMVDFKEPLNIDFAFAQSIFSHCGQDLLATWIEQISHHLSDTGALVATFLLDSADYPGDGWVYPECVCYRPNYLSELADKVGLNFEVLDWAHPRQTWALLAKPGFDRSGLEDKRPQWNRLISSLQDNQKVVSFNDQAEAQVPANDITETQITTWSRVVMNKQVNRLLSELPLNSIECLEISGNKWSHLGYKSYQTIDYPAFDICSETLDESYDLIIAEQVFEHLLYPYRAAKNVLSMLRPGGYFLISVPFLVKVHEIPVDCTRWTELGLKHFLHDCGFTLDTIKTGSWGNRECIKANFDDWVMYDKSIHDLKNEPDFPYHVWALARAPGNQK